jgi:transcription termination/antitermination protein NusA
MNIDIMEAITQIAKDKKIEKENLRDMLENIFIGMIQKRYGTSDNFDVIVNIDKGDIEIYQEKTVVENVEDSVSEITLEDALKIDEDAEMGEEIVEVIDPVLFGRRLIVAAKQNLNQRIRDFEKENLIEEYENRIGEIIIGDIHQIHKRGMYVNVDKTEVFLPRDEQIYNERLRRGNTIRCLIKEVRNTGRGPEIIVSRSDEQFLIRLFELEVPEIYDGIVDIKKVAREAGERSKISVESIDRRIDPVGACVGMKGVRIQSIVKELNNEKIDIISYSSEPEIFIMRAMTPAKPVKIIVNKEERMAVAVIPDDMMALAIGRNGVNLRMASLLTDYQIEPIKESEYDSESSIDYASTAIEDVEELANSVKLKLVDAGLKNISDLAEKGVDGLKEIDGIGPKTVDKIWEVVQKYLDTEDEE